MRVVAIVQARMGSTRLPGKALLDIAGEPMLQHVLARTLAIDGLVDVVVATTTLARDDVIEAFCDDTGRPCFRGDEADVLDRYYRAAIEARADHVLRVTSDCPLVCPREAGRVIARHLETGADYTHNITLGGSGMPLGTGVEAFTMEALEASWTEGSDPAHREHVDEFILERPERFRIEVVEPPPALRHPELRVTVDTAEDLEVIRAIYDRLYRPPELVELVDAIALVASAEAAAP